MNPATDFGLVGPSGERTGKALSGIVDIDVGSVRERRRFKGPDRHPEWIGCWRIFHSTMLVTEASPPGPLDAYEKSITMLHARFPSRFAILAMVDAINRHEKWQQYREEVEELVAMGTPPRFYDAR